MLVKADKTVDWDAVIADPRFQTLHRKKTAFLWGLMVFSVAYRSRWPAS